MKKAAALPSLRLDCEIVAPSEQVAADLARIVRHCAADVGQQLQLYSQARHDIAAPVLTMHLPAALAATQHPVWCLACRLACFCPEARVSVLVHAAGFFGQKAPVKARSRRSAKAV